MNDIILKRLNDNKIVVFIDTNIFEEIGYNFDLRNKIIKQYIDLCKENKVRNVIVSVIDNEIKKHINIRIEESKRAIKKYCKWIYGLVDEKKIDNNINKNLIDYEEFKKQTKSEMIEINNINPEIVMNKYFNMKYPFEIRKPNEFKDAFFLEAVFEYVNAHLELNGALIVTKDNGIVKAVEEKGIKRINCCSKIDEVIDTILNVSIEEKSKILKYLKSYDFDNQIPNKITVNIECDEESNVVIDDYECSGVLTLNVIKVEDNKMIVSCDILINLLGNFKCLDYDKSYYSEEKHEYVYKEYKNKNYLGYICPTIIEITKDGDKYKEPKIIEIEQIEIDEDSFMDIEDYFNKD